MLCVWWNYEGMLHIADLYFKQLQQLHEVLWARYPSLVNRQRVLLLHDNAPAHTSRKTQNKIEELGDIEILPHPPYSPDLAPSDYYLFRSLAHFLLGRQFINVDDVEVACLRLKAKRMAHRCADSSFITLPGVHRQVSPVNINHSFF